MERIRLSVQCLRGRFQGSGPLPGETVVSPERFLSLDYLKFRGQAASMRAPKYDQFRGGSEIFWADWKRSPMKQSVWETVRELLKRGLCQNSHWIQPPTAKSPWVKGSTQPSSPTSPIEIDGEGRVNGAEKSATPPTLLLTCTLAICHLDSGLLTVWYFLFRIGFL